MARLSWLLLAVLVAWPAYADMFQDGSNSKFPEAQYNLGIGAAGNPKDFDPLCDGRTTEAEVTAGTAHDCTAAINSAAAVTVGGVTANVKLQAGVYYITNTLNILSGQTIVGEGRSKTRIRVRDTFNPAAQGVVLTAGNPTDRGGGLRDLTISFDQPTTQGSRAAFQLLGSCTSGSGGTGCKYPAAVVLMGGRTMFQNTRIERAWDGIAANSVASVNSPGGNGNSVIRVLYLEMSALNNGLWLDGALDESQVEGFHFWPFGISSASALYAGVIQDGVTDCMRIGGADGFRATNLFCHAANLHFVPSVVTAGDAIGGGAFVNVSLDHGGRLIFNAANNLTVVNLVQSAGAGLAVPPNCSLTIAATNPGDRMMITNYWVQNHYETPVCVTSGALHLAEARIINYADKPSVTVAGGVLYMRDVHWGNNGATVRTAPIIKQTAGSMVLSGHTNSGPTVGGGGVAIETTTDNNTLTDIDMGGYGLSFGCGPTTAGWCFTGTPLGFYDLPTYPFTMTATPTFTGTTDFAPANATTSSQWWLRGNKVEFWLRSAFDTNAHTTGTDFRIQTTLPTSLSGLGSSRTCVLSNYQKLAGYTALEPRCSLINNAGNTASDINFNFPVPGGTITTVARANIPASTTGFLFGISGWYPVR